MKRKYEKLGLWFLAFIFTTSANGQYTDVISGSELYELPNGKYLEITLVDTNSVGVKLSSGNWVLNPNYCAISAYSHADGVASVRDCPFDYNYSQMAYWYDEPLTGKWGVVDTLGNWLIKPNYLFPFSLIDSVQIATQESFNTELYWNLKPAWPDVYQQVIPLRNNQYLVQNNDELGIRELSGEWQIAYGRYHFIEFDSFYIFFPIKDEKANFNKPLKVVNFYGEVESKMGFEAWEFYTNKIIEQDAIFESFYYFDNLASENVQDLKGPFKNWLFELIWEKIILNESNRRFTIDDADFELGEFDQYDIVADSLYLQLPDGWFPYYRVDEYDYFVEVEEFEQSAYSVCLQSYSNNHGSRGPCL